MGKFSDPNYDLLQRYFNVLKSRETGTQLSYIAGPKRGIWADGGAFTVLYENNATKGFVGHKFLIKEIDGNRFKMEYKGVFQDFKKYRTSTETASLSAFDIGNEMYFRKDSFFHAWLARSENEAFRNYVNQERTFAFFGKLWPSDSDNNIYAIEFEGLKDYTLRALPPHNRTTNVEEWLNVYFDQVHHEPYTMLKTLWSMMDAREIDFRWLGYIANIYGIEIAEEMAELNLREWVENLIYFLKRIGTYNALYVVYKLYLSNSTNVMNVYERWDEWCQPEIRDIDTGGLANVASYDRFPGFHPGIPAGVYSYFGPEVFPINDFNWLEFYGQQPSGGAGDLWYTQFNPVKYPTHAQEGPTEDCNDEIWQCGPSESFFCYDDRDASDIISAIQSFSVSVVDFDTINYLTATLSLSGQSFSGNFQHCAGVTMSNQTTENCSFIFYGLSNDYINFGVDTGNWIGVAFERISPTQRRFAIYEQFGGTKYSTVGSETGYLVSTRYKIGVERNCAANTLTVYIYDGKRREENLVETITHTLQGCPDYSYLHAIQSFSNGLDGKFYGTVWRQHVDFSTLTLGVGPTGYPVLTPHYIVEIDLNNQPLIDVQPFNQLFAGEDFIINEFLADELIRNWEYVRPVMKHVVYHELLAPPAKEERIATSVPLYPLDSNGFFNTFFVGSKYLSAGAPTPSAGVATYLHIQEESASTWNINHNLNSRYNVVQTWENLEGASCNQNKKGLAKRIEPDNVCIIDENNLSITFGAAINGWATIAGKAWALTYEHTECGCPDEVWTIFHDFEDTPSAGGPKGYPSGVGPLVNFWMRSSSSSSTSSSSESQSSSSSSSSSSLSSSSSSSESSSSSTSSSSSSSESSSSSTSSSSSSSELSVSNATLVGGCQYEYNAFSEDMVVDGDNSVRFPLVAKLEDDNIAVVWAEQISGVPQYSALYGQRFSDCCSPILPSATRIEGGGALPPVWDWGFSVNQNIDYMFGEDKLVYVTDIQNPYIGIHFVIIDAPPMTQIGTPTVATTSYDQPVAYAFDNGFTILMANRDATPPSAGIWKMNFNHLGAQTGSPLQITGKDILPSWMTFHTGAKLKEDVSQYIMQTYYADYTFAGGAALSHVRAMVVTKEGARVNRNIMVSRNTGQGRDLPGTVVDVQDPDDNSWGFMVIWWEGDTDFNATVDGSLSVRRYTKGGTIVVGPNPSASGVVELFNAASYTFRPRIGAVRTYDGKFVVIALNDYTFNRMWTMTIEIESLQTVVPLSLVSPTVFTDNPWYIQAFRNVSGGELGFDPPNGWEQYCFHNKDENIPEDLAQIWELKTISSSSSSTSSSSSSSSSESSSSESSSSSSESSSSSSSESSSSSSESSSSSSLSSSSLSSSSSSSSLSSSSSSESSSSLSSSSSSESSSSTSSSSESFGPLALDAPNSQNFNSGTLGLPAPTAAAQEANGANSGSVMTIWTEWTGSTPPKRKLLINDINSNKTNNFSTRLDIHSEGGGGIGITQLSNGNMAIVVGANTGGFPLGVSGTVVEPLSGTEVVPIFEIFNTNVQDGADCAAWDTGYWVAAWHDNLANDGKYRVYSNAGVPVSAAANFTANNNDPRLPKVACLDNGNFVVTYFLANTQEIQFSLITSGGSPLALQNVVSDAVFSTEEGNGVVALPGGKFIISYLEWNANNDFKLMLKKFNSTGSLEVSATVDDPPSTDPGGGDPYDSWELANILKTDSGVKVIVVAKSSGNDTYYVWVYDTDLNLTQSRTQLFVSNDTGGGNLNLASFGDGKYAVINRRNETGANPYGERVYVEVIFPSDSSSSMSSSSESSSSSSSSSDSSSSSSISSSSYSLGPFVPFFNNTFWTPSPNIAKIFGFTNNTTWTGASWASFNPTGNVWWVFLAPIGGWELGYRPMNIRVTMDLAAKPYITVRLLSPLSPDVNPSPNHICDTGPYISGTTIALDWSLGLELTELFVWGNGSAYANFNVTNIEFQ